jgi:branched-chain amino acid transport system ATP-binding protein
VTTRQEGRVHFGDTDVSRMRAERRAAMGIGWVPQERNIFRSLTVEENLTSIARPGLWNTERVYGMFPRLRERRSNLGNQLSGGEQQMLAVARALMLNPKLLLLDEPLEGLAPIIVDELLAALHDIVTGEGMSAIIVEQKARKVLPLTDEAIVLERGAVVHRGSSAALLAAPDMLEKHLSV